MTNSTAVQSLSVKLLKGLRDLEIGPFPESGLVVLMGPNGAGKSTILHALACLYNPLTEDTIATHKWSHYFIPHGDSTWRGSEVTARFHGENEPIVYGNEHNRWTPRYNRRPKRVVEFLNIRGFVPHLEEEKKRTGFRYKVSLLTDSEEKKILMYANRILGGGYTSIKAAKKDSGTVKDFLEVSREVSKETKTSYTSYYMGAGEQKIFYILLYIIKCPKNSTVLIEELETFLHDKATSEIIKIISEIARERCLQVFISTHWARVTDIALENCRIFTIRRTLGGRTLCAEGHDLEAIYALSGRNEDIKCLNLWVEDDTAEDIVKNAARRLHALQYVKIRIFGSASNAFSIAAAAALEGREDTVAVIDGDVFAAEAEKAKAIKKSLSGSDEKSEEKRKKALTFLTSFAPLNGENPETFLLSTLLKHREDAEGEIRPYLDYVAQHYTTGVSAKEIFRGMAGYFGETPAECRSEIISFVRTKPEWDAYIEGVCKNLELLIAKFRCQTLSPSEPEKTPEFLE